MAGFYTAPKLSPFLKFHCKKLCTQDKATLFDIIERIEDANESWKLATTKILNYIMLYDLFESVKSKSS